MKYPWRRPFGTLPVLLTQDSFEDLCRSVSVEPRNMLALMLVETNGYGFARDHSIRMLYERHYFSRLSGGVWDRMCPDISNPAQGGDSSSQVSEYGRLKRAFNLNHSIALQSASWGVGQVMGQNMCQASLENDIQKMAVSELEQLKQVVSFLQCHGILGALARERWADVARKYDGAGYTRNEYDQRLAEAFDACALFDWRVRYVQIQLYHRGETLAIDGIAGRQTQRLARKHSLTLPGDE